jgi:hypothetical protein
MTVCYTGQSKQQKTTKKLQADLEQLEIWAKDWGMRFNAKKCYILSINKKSNKFYSLDNTIRKILYVAEE